MLGCFSLFISWISLSMFVLFERCLFIFSTITFPVTWKWILVTREGSAGCSAISFFVVGIGFVRFLNIDEGSN